MLWLLLGLLALACLLSSGRRTRESFAGPGFDAVAHAGYQALPDPAPEAEWEFTRGVYDRATRLPGAQVLSSTRPRALILRSFLTPEETQFLIEDNRTRLTPSQVVSEGGESRSDVRTSSGAWARDSETLRRITARIHRAVGVPEPFGEGLYVLNYQLKQKYEAHNDHCADTGDDAVDKGCAALLSQAGGPACGRGAGGPTCGDRIATFILYLKSPTAGGRTVFPESDATRRALATAGTTPADAAAAPPSADGVEWYCSRGEVLGAAPRAGDALLFWNYEPGPGASDAQAADDGAGSRGDGTARPSARRVYQAMHSGCPVLGGEKWIATRWIRGARMR